MRRPNASKQIEQITNFSALPPIPPPVPMPAEVRPIPEIVESLARPLIAENVRNLAEDFSNAACIQDMLVLTALFLLWNEEKQQPCLADVIPKLFESGPYTNVFTRPDE